MTANLHYNMQKITWAKITDAAKIPSKRREDAGYDLYCVEKDTIVLKPHETRLFSIGIASAFDEDYVGIIKERGSTGVLGISVRSGVIDSGYRGEWKVCLTNLNDYDVEFSWDVNGVTKVMRKFNKKKVKKVIYPFRKAIAQVIFMPILNSDNEEVSYETLKNYGSQRGEGGWGDSGK